MPGSVASKPAQAAARTGKVLSLFEDSLLFPPWSPGPINSSFLISPSPSVCNMWKKEQGRKRQVCQFLTRLPKEVMPGKVENRTVDTRTYTEILVWKQSHCSAVTWARAENSIRLENEPQFVFGGDIWTGSWFSSFFSSSCRNQLRFPWDPPERLAWGNSDHSPRRRHLPMSGGNDLRGTLLQNNMSSGWKVEPSAP